MGFVCPAGHASDESDYCSVCGAAIPASPAASGVAPPSGALAAPSRAGAGQAPRGQGCPVCGEARAHEARFCEVCRYDFVTQASGPVPPPAPRAPASVSPAAPPSPSVASPSVASPPPSPSAPGGAPSPVAARWLLVVTVDPSLDTEPDPAAPPPVEPERVFPVDLTEMLVGRRDDQQHIRPAVPVHDPGASRRHARFLLGADGGVSLHDLASTNGTKLNGRDVVSGSIVPLTEGDEVTLGRWTRIRLQVRT